ncbi:hypothetical protein E3O53_04465 [Cryobacterium sp. TMT2-18-3]|uniref:hypothetical protein n=1 Tax=unclassified Cryobacterium TaxID=2649013 RepID=UPI00106CE985|nr:MULTISPECIES: hypothetical protein [unclassified Cryobacterium]TFC29897.1 hypothetical protein E3O22_05210 [Cryobacterium sp. TMT2-18-2]TFC55812.1 hypothetical protein E3O62_13765 [Cryobacterium sp. TMT2-15-1]TFC66070.1 hypothetical protein E3O53_04465 [Cryobacterium sp. TMT2-18-3]
MRHTRGAISFRRSRHVFHFAVLAVLTLAAMLLCLLAVHSAGTGHGLAHPPAHSLSAAPTSSTPVTATAMAVGAHSATAHTATSPDTVGNADTHSMSGLAALSMTCSLLLILGALIVLSRRPSFYRRLLEAGGFIVSSFREIPLHLHRPSLTLLSISRT